MKFKFMVNNDEFTFGKCALDIKKNYIHDRSREGFSVGVVDMPDFLKSVVIATIYESCAAFAIKIDGDVLLAVKSGNSSQVLKLGNHSADYSDLGRIAKELDVQCYGLLVEDSAGHWIVIEE